MNRVGGVWVTALALVVLGAACGGGGSEEASGDPSGDTALADAVRIEDGVDARTGERAEFAAVSDPVPVAVGDTVRTDGTGFAEVSYFDGSVARLDVDSTFDVLALEDEPGGSEVRTRMGVGRTWHRVRGLAGEDVYVVETSVATATVRGTAFVVHCPEDDTCTFSVYEGELEVELTADDAADLTLTAGETVTVTTKSGARRSQDAGSVEDEDWLRRNAELDMETGFDDLADEEQASSGDGLPDLTGDWQFTFVPREVKLPPDMPGLGAGPTDEPRQQDFRLECGSVCQLETQVPFDVPGSPFNVEDFSEEPRPVIVLDPFETSFRWRFESATKPCGDGGPTTSFFIDLELHPGPEGETLTGNARREFERLEVETERSRCGYANVTWDVVAERQ